MTAFERLTPALQYQITQTLGFAALRPVQELTIPPVLDGKNCVVLAPTAGGKTEAAFFPVLSMIDARDSKPVSVLYTSPIRALLNNQEDRVMRYAATIGRRAFKWHGDVGPTQRKKFIKDPADILLTTPESLEAMLMSPRVPAHQLFRGLETVIIDEVHAFAHDDRGAHLSSVLERLTRYCGRDVQRIGLSATVGNPEEILNWLHGRSKRDKIVISPPKEPKTPHLSLDHVGSVEAAAIVTDQLHRGKKRLVFVDSRKGVEEFAKQLVARDVDTYLAHGSLALSIRQDAERAFAERTNCVIVATSVLELGIDVGDLDHVVQLETPRTVASFLQRMGRTGRRTGTTPNCTFLTTKSDTLLQAAGLLRLHARGFIESVHPSRHAVHILAHQIMGLAVQERGVPRGDWWAWLDGATPFETITAEERDALFTYMLEKEILADQDGRIWLGTQGEKLYGRANFRELYAAFSVPREMVVLWADSEVGTVDSTFLETLTSKQKNAVFILAGKAWEVDAIDWKRALCHVKPSKSVAKAARWMGGKGPLGFELCQSMRDVLLTDNDDLWWSKRTREAIAGLRMQHKFLREGDTILDDADGVTWWTFAGGKANLLLSRMLENDLGGTCVVKDISIAWRTDASASSLRNLVRKLAAASRPTEADAFRHAAGAARRRLTKFEPCLPKAMLDALTVEKALDAVGASEAIKQAI